MAPRRLPARPSMLAITPGDPLEDSLGDDLGAGIFNDSVSDENDVGESDVSQVSPEPDDPCPFPDGYTPRTIQEATLLEQWCGRQHVKHAKRRHEAELNAGRQSVVDTVAQLEAARVRTREEQIADAAADILRAELVLETARRRHQALIVGESETYPER